MKREMQRQSEIPFSTDRVTNSTVKKFKKIMVIGLGQLGLWNI